ncbi:spermidine/putrescine ABC transporter substrate-binding protein [Bdellovibrio bacteriovorus]|uniref:polyamine ABC transporter substrate-binding protein n=1 Tax=Bdellovibrio bacteriovorus TaxID=959 RepID=UPI000B19534E|nr:spermidine/putrescine ABC transporter substrate-binding protein [Bdellovibrio bacteriovorus]BEV67865.1 Spermidine/putrescine-binding periplasmic protein [Bdellovibrio bacteriovorus]
MSRILMVGLALCGLLAGCTKKSAEVSEAKEVNLSIWGNYISPELQAQFEKETGIKINISNYSSNEELLAKVQMGSSGIDVAVPSDYMVEVMSKMNLLEALNPDQISNKTLIDPQFLKQNYDPENKFSLPYIWTTAGIAVNRDLYKGPIKSWKDLLENPQLKGKFALLDDVRETLGAALKMNGFSVNSTNPEEINKAKATLLKAKKNVKMFASDTIDILNNKEVAAAQTYSSDALQAADKSPGKIEYIIPEEGGTFAIDNLVIIKGAKHPEAAHKLINFLLSEQAEINRVKTILGGPVLKNTKAALPKELQNNRALFPDEATLKKLERIQDQGEKNKLFEDSWTEIKTH